MAMDKNDLIDFVIRLENISDMSSKELEVIYNANLSFMERSIDAPIKE
jgi:hypothetical protein